MEIEEIKSESYFTSFKQTKNSNELKTSLKKNQTIEPITLCLSALNQILGLSAVQMADEGLISIHTQNICKLVSELYGQMLSLDCA